jgi:flagellar basal-body rod protein FlgG
MNAAMYKALSGAIVQMRRLESVSQDLANVNTAGYKGERLVFREILADPTQRQSRAGGQVAVTEQRTDLSNGEFRATNNPFDLAIHGDGFFAIQTSRGVRYTRQGTFSLSANNTVVTPAGEPVLGEGGPVRLTGAKMDVTADGTVLSDGKEVDKLKVVRFADPTRLVREGATVFRAPDGEAQPAANSQVLQGNLEQANVNPIETMVTLIDLQRQFDAYERAMRTMDSVTEKVVNQAAQV